MDEKQQVAVKYCNNLTYGIGYNIESNSFFSVIFGDQGYFYMLNTLQGSLKQKNI